MLAAEPWGDQLHILAGYSSYQLKNYQESLKHYTDAHSKNPTANNVGNLNCVKKALLNVTKACVYQEIYSHLGDCWWFMNHIMGLPHQEDPIYICDTAEYLNIPIGNRLKEIIPLLENPNFNRIEIIEPCGQRVPVHREWDTLEPVSTKVKWLGIDSKRICYQFDGQFRAETKNPPVPELELILASLSNAGFTLVKLGSEITLEQCVKELAVASYFIGCHSGMAHLAVSVGTPSVLYVPEAARFSEGHWMGDMFSRFAPRIKLAKTAEELLEKLEVKKDGSKITTQIKKKNTPVDFPDCAYFLTKLYRPNAVYQETYDHFGDIWFFCAALMQMPVQDPPIRVCKIAKEHGIDISNTAQSILPLLENKHGHTFEFIDPPEDNSNVVTFHANWNVMKPVPTLKKWAGNLPGAICFQFDSVYQSGKKDPSLKELNAIFDEFKDKELIRVGLPLTIQQIVGILEKSACFIGSDSGMSHVAISMGVPVFLYAPAFDEGYGVIQAACDNMKICRNVKELIDSVKAHIQ
jgi:hypothetical protein